MSGTLRTNNQDDEIELSILMANCPSETFGPLHYLFQQPKA